MQTSTKRTIAASISALFIALTSASPHAWALSDTCKNLGVYSSSPEAVRLQAAIAKRRDQQILDQRTQEVRLSDPSGTRQIESRIAQADSCLNEANREIAENSARRRAAREAERISRTLAGNSAPQALGAQANQSGIAPSPQSVGGMSPALTATDWANAAGLLMGNDARAVLMPFGGAIY